MDIQYKIYTRFLWLFFCFTFLLFISCGEDEVNPDLLYDFADLEMEEVDAGEPLVLQSAILNDRAICEDCFTMASGECDRGLRLEYRADVNSPWVDAQLEDQDGNIVFEIIKPVPVIQAGSMHTQTEGFIFSNPGLYRYKLASDRTEIVAERIETNNDATTTQGDVKAAGANNNGRVYNLIVRVDDPSGAYLPVPSGKQPVPVVYLEY